MNSDADTKRPASRPRLQVVGPRLTPSEERALLWTIRHGADEPARQHAMSKLWQTYHGLVAMVANRHRRGGLEISDLIGAGQLGLHAAIVRFDPDRFAGRLSTYAVPWIRWYIQDHISRNTGPVRLPSTTAHRQLRRWSTRLFDDARRDCEREQVQATDMELYARVGRRVGLSADEVARQRQAQGGATVPVDTLSAFEADIDDRAPEDTVIRPVLAPNGHQLGAAPNTLISYTLPHGRHPRDFLAAPEARSLGG